MRYLLLLIALATPAITSVAQDDLSDLDSAIIDSAMVADTTTADSAKVADTLVFTDINQLANTNPVTSPYNFEEHLCQKPTVALLKSMVLPGWGQVGNRSYIKAAIFAGLDIWFVGAAIHYGRQASDFRDSYESAVEIDLRNEYYDLYKDRKNERNKYTWFAVIITFVSMFDAYADAHLSGYPHRLDDDPVAIHLDPTPDGGIQASVSVSF